MPRAWGSSEEWCKNAETAEVGESEIIRQEQQNIGAERFGLSGKIRHRESGDGQGG
jgi:hypothetical protein